MATWFGGYKLTLLFCRYKQTKFVLCVVFMPPDCCTQTFQCFAFPIVCCYHRFIMTVYMGTTTSLSWPPLTIWGYCWLLIWCSLKHKKSSSNLFSVIFFFDEKASSSVLQFKTWSNPICSNIFFSFFIRYYKKSFGPFSPQGA